MQWNCLLIQICIKHECSLHVADFHSWSSVSSSSAWLPPLRGEGLSHVSPIDLLLCLLRPRYPHKLLNFLARLPSLGCQCVTLNYQRLSCLRATCPAHAYLFLISTKMSSTLVCSLTHSALFLFRKVAPIIFLSMACYVVLDLSWSSIYRPWRKAYTHQQIELPLSAYKASYVPAFPLSAHLLHTDRTYPLWASTSKSNGTASSRTEQCFVPRQFVLLLLHTAPVSQQLQKCLCIVKQNLFCKAMCLAHSDAFALNEYTGNKA